MPRCAKEGAAHEAQSEVAQLVKTTNPEIQEKLGRVDWGCRVIHGGTQKRPA